MCKVNKTNLGGNEKMKKYNMVDVATPHNIEHIDSLEMYYTDLDFKSDFYNLEWVEINEVEHDELGKLIELVINRTEEIKFNEELTSENVDSFKNKFIETDQKGETYIESLFFRNTDDARRYVVGELNGKRKIEDLI